jgi:hypothetical protein
MFTLEAAAWGWYRHQYPHLSLRAQTQLRNQFGRACDTPLIHIENLLTDPEKSFKLTTALQDVAHAIKQSRKPVPMKGVSLGKVISVSQALGLMAARADHEASRQYRQMILRTFTTIDARVRFEDMERSVKHLLLAAQTFLRQAVQTQVSGPMLVAMMLNLRYELLLRLWFQCNDRHLALFNGLDVVRASGACVMWFKDVHAVAIMADPQT